MLSKIKCYIKGHDWAILPDKYGDIHFLTGPRRCMRCNKKIDELNWPKPKCRPPKNYKENMLRDETLEKNN